MRDPKRIPEILKAIQADWEKEPDWRFGQWFCNTIIDTFGDPFHVEDDDLILLLTKKYQKRK